MSIRNKIIHGYVYFLTLTVAHILLDSIRYCQSAKGLEVYAWCIMSNHVHLVAGVKEDGSCSLSDVLRDLKKFANKKILNEIQTGTEIRRKWMLNQFEFAFRQIQAVGKLKSSLGK